MTKAAKKSGVTVCGFIRAAALAAAALVLTACTPALDTSPRIAVQTEHATVIGPQVSVGQFLTDNNISRDISLTAKAAGKPIIPMTFMLTSRDGVINRCRMGVRVTACNIGGGLVYLEADAPRTTVLEEIAHSHYMDEFAAWQLRCKVEWRGCGRFDRH